MTVFPKDNFSDPLITYEPYAGDWGMFAEILAAYGKNGGIHDITQLSRNEINSSNYKVVLENETLLVRRNQLIDSEAQVRRYMSVVEALMDLGIPVSEAIKTIDGQGYVQRHGILYTVFRFIDGSHFVPTQEALASVAMAVAKVHKGLAGLEATLASDIEGHSKQTKAYFNVIPSYTEKDFVEIAEHIEQKDVRTQTDEMVIASMPALRAAVVRVDANRAKIDALPTQIIHSDLHPHNVIMKGDTLAAILDFDALRVSQRARDVAFAIYRFGRQFFVDQSTADVATTALSLTKIFLSAYEAEMPLARQEKDLLHVLILDDFLIKTLYVLREMYTKTDSAWAGDITKFLTAFDEITYFTPQIHMDKREQLKEIQQYIPGASQTLSKTPTQFVVGVTPLTIARAQGVHIWDADGNKYLDFLMALGPMVFGYAHNRINTAVKEQIDRGTIFSLPSEKELELATVLREVVPCAEMSRFLINGNDATSGAIRLARYVTGRDHVAKCGYHGWQDWSICTKAGRSNGVPESIKTMTHDFEYNNPASLEKIFRENPDSICAVILEPASSEHPTDDFLAKIKEIAHAHGALLIFDEMVTGFRWALGGAQEYYGVTPDIGCFGKAISGGFPLSAICGKAEYMRRMDEVFVSTTFGGYVPGMVAALETIAMMREFGDVHSHLFDIGQYMIDRGNAIARKYEVPIILSGCGPHPVMTIQLQDDYEARVYKTFVYEHLHKSGILFTSSVLLSYLHTREHVDEFLTVFDRACDMLASFESIDAIVASLEGDIVAPRTVRNTQ
ncbi:MAG: hypothetical protein COU35_03870 [Candidatus Magasanikbacteria bacterium CG10_big_fil_rev_8_21_14_0_10_47_10]|uniref:Aminoglycoside phosphotransferase domain-containing protein n=1 Tax=Candidatus Magasanikbacteria bacterium CG10_big_fil_rev_8_21_14_0_10_47_10 TaxID=1974652 RepID=A0A2H0TPS4_9BACT|nr:MAG: hypothetical protein COU35_03870 [Candidatus Magasanikbacteria bacterium CG10_big_fil_rev_8_21_14_0_10_47_10]